LALLLEQSLETYAPLSAIAQGQLSGARADSLPVSNNSRVDDGERTNKCRKL